MIFAMFWTKAWAWPSWGGVLAVLFFQSTLAWAQNFEDQKAIMQAQIELLHKQAELQAAWRQVGSVQTLNLPQIVSISSLQGRYSVRLDLGSGQQRNFSLGDRVREDLSIQGIGPDQVSVTYQRGRERRVLPLNFLSTQGANGPLAGRGSSAGVLGSDAGGSHVPPLPLEMLGSLPSVTFPTLRWSQDKGKSDPKSDPKQALNAALSAINAAAPTPTPTPTPTPKRVKD